MLTRHMGLPDDTRETGGLGEAAGRALLRDEQHLRSRVVGGGYVGFSEGGAPDDVAPERRYAAGSRHVLGRQLHQDLF